MSPSVMMPPTSVGTGSNLSVRLSPAVRLVVAIILCVLVPGLLQAGKPSWQSRYISRWKEEMHHIDRLLLARDWKQANREAEKLLTEMSREVKTGSGGLTGGALTERSVALAGLGKVRDAGWYACMADVLWDHAADQLGRYGKIGLQLRKAISDCRVRVRASEWVAVHSYRGPTDVRRARRGAHSSRRSPYHGRGESGAKVTAPFVRTKIPPKYPAGVQAGRGEGKVIVAVFVDKDGVPSCPALESRTSYVPLVYSVLDALKEWRFKPATLDGKPIEIQYVLTVRFRLSR